jgi:thymidylate synthase ThyX
LPRVKVNKILEVVGLAKLPKEHRRTRFCGQSGPGYVASGGVAGVVCRRMPDANSSPPHKLGPPRESESPDVYAVHGAEPEVQAYAMAKYSRSALSMKESLREIDSQRAEKFLNTFYFQYGHRSIADLAHLAMAIESLSLLAAIAVVDEQRWDGQERSTRYQDFSRPSYHIPDFGDDRQARSLYVRTIELLFADYRELSEGAFEYLRSRVPRPIDMAADQYERTLRARAFDVARYLLPLASNTSLGQIVSARTLEGQVARLLSSEYAEVRRLGEALKRAANEPAYNVNQWAWAKILEEIKGMDEGVGRKLEYQVLKPVKVAPTLVKYADASPHQIDTRRELRQAAAEVMGNAEIEAAPPVDLLDDEPLEIELTSTLLYEHCHYPYRQVRKFVAALGEKRRQEIIDLGTKHRGAHDELLRPFCAGQKFRFDILMDIGGYRDLHRHRRCIQVGQGFTTAHGFETPDEVPAAGMSERYDQAMCRARDSCHRLQSDLPPGSENSAEYLIPLGYRKRTLFKMDFAEVVYIAELRTAPAGHMSYRRIAYQMYESVARRHPGLAGCFRVHDPSEPVDLLQR